MCNLSQGVWNEGRMEGIVQGRTEGLIEGQSKIVLNMMKTTKQTIQEVMNLLGIEEALRCSIEQRINSLYQTTE